MYILLVEDDPRVASVVQEAFANRKWRTEHVSDGDEGLACARRGKPASRPCRWR